MNSSQAQCLALVELALKRLRAKWLHVMQLHIQSALIYVRIAALNWVVNTSGVEKVNITCLTQTPCIACSTPLVPVGMTCSSSTPKMLTTSRNGWQPCVDCLSCALVTVRQFLSTKLNQCLKL